MQTLFEQLAGARVFDLAQSYFPGMPHHPTHPPFLFSLVKKHGEFVGPARLRRSLVAGLPVADDPKAAAGSEE